MFNTKIFRVSLLASAICLAACSDEQTSAVDTQHLDRAQVYEEQGQYQAAAIEYRNAVKKSGDLAVARVQYSQMLNTIGQYGSAAELLNQIEFESIADASKLPYAEVLLTAYLGMGKYYSAQKLLSTSLVEQGDVYRVQQARIYLAQGKVDQARRLISAELKQNNSDEARVVLAQVLFEKGQADKAVGLIEQVAETSEFYDRAHIVKAGVEIFQNDLAAAESTLTKLLVRMPSTDTMLPEKAIVLERMSYVLTRLGRTNEAFSYSKLLSDAFPGANEVMDQYKSAFEAFKARDFALSKQKLEELLSVQPNHPHAKQLMGIIAYFEGDQASAAAYFDDSVDPELSSELTNEIYAANSLRMNEPKKVVEILESQVETTNSASILILYGVAAITNGQVEEGEKALLRAIEVDPKDIRSRLALASHYQTGSTARMDSALDQLESAYLLEPKNLKVLASLTRYHATHGGREKAEEFVAQILSTHPKAYGPNLTAGYFRASQGDFVGALPYFSRAVEAKDRDQDYSQALLAKARTQAQLTKYDEAQDSFGALVKAYPTVSEGYQGLFASLVQTKGMSEAETELLKLADLPEHSEALYVLIANAARRGDFDLARERIKVLSSWSEDQGRILQAQIAIAEAAANQAMRARDFNTARAELGLVIELDAQRIVPLAMMASLEIEEKNLDVAANFIADIERLDPSHPAVPLLRGDIALEREDQETALGLFKNAWQKAPSNATGEKIYRLLTTLKDLEQRKAFLDDWMVKQPNAPQPVIVRAMELQGVGDNSKAEDLYRGVLNQQPNNALVLNNLGWILFEKNDKESLSMLSRAVELSPGNAAILDSYGWALYKFGEPKKALPYLEKAHLSAPDSVEIKAHYEEVKAANK